MEEKKMLFLICIVPVFLLLLALAVALYKLCKKRAARSVLPDSGGTTGRFVQLEEEGGAEQVKPLPPEQRPSPQLERAQLGPLDIPVPGIGGCVLAREGILAVEPGMSGVGWYGNVVVLDPGGTIFHTRRYAGGGASGALYGALGVLNTFVERPLANRLGMSHVVYNPRIFKGRFWQACVIHLHSPDMSRLSRPPGTCARILRDQLYSLFIEAFALVQRERLPDTSVVMVPLVSSGIYSGNINREGYVRAFSDAFLTASHVFCGGTSLAAALGVREVRICCYGEGMQRALAEEMQQQAVGIGQQASIAK
ncbi:hypothetical protein [Neorickettsia sennetsu]|uniref:Macro domain-containing protein n=1 Tax=Ehrlichia sennetsu (strain ATCC VR-367 / Miyayama) TaxID=222891 RepID=Q2GET9_EHRS3|nr:hypothetical protein [Neorickettsia sennetsu]ABD46364.1 hypothetical protein NSE_0107 [Neorickettsia sennetsu str. Miyayama]